MIIEQTRAGIVKYREKLSPERDISAKDFWRVLSEAEQRGLAGSTAQAAKALLWELAIVGSLNAQEMLSVLNRMEAAGFIDASRKAEILSALG